MIQMPVNNQQVVCSEATSSQMKKPELTLREEEEELLGVSMNLGRCHRKQVLAATGMKW
jgi:hypothetical protein